MKIKFFEDSDNALLELGDGVPTTPKSPHAD
jgi:hypothetical protein